MKSLWYTGYKFIVAWHAKYSSLFPFRKRSLPFLTVDTTISNQPFLSSHDRCNIFPGLSYKKAKNTFSNSVKKNDVGAQVEFSLKCTKRARVTCY